VVGGEEKGWGVQGDESAGGGFVSS
jgi:hypothetical protein